MKIKSIYLSNIDKLYELANIPNSENLMFYLKEMIKITSKVYITISLENVNPYDLLFLNKMNFVYRGIESTINLDESTKIDNVDDDVNRSVIKLYKLLNYHEEQEKSKIYQKLLPVYTYHYNIDIVFNGNTINNLFQYSLKELFINPENSKVIDINDIETIKNNIATGFYRIFYQNQYNFYKSIDTASESLEQSSFFKYNNGDAFTIHQIIGPYDTQVDFINNTKDTLDYQYSLFKKEYNNQLKSNYKVVIECKTTLQTLTDLILNTKVVDSYENPMIMLTSTNFYVPEELGGIYNKRYSEDLNEFIVLRDFHKKDAELNKYLYMPMNTIVRYTLLIPFNDILSDSDLTDFIKDELMYIDEMKKDYNVVGNNEIANLNQILSRLKVIIK